MFLFEVLRNNHLNFELFQEEKTNKQKPNKKPKVFFLLLFQTKIIQISLR